MRVSGRFPTASAVTTKAKSLRAQGSSRTTPTSTLAGVVCSPAYLLACLAASLRKRSEQGPRAAIPTRRALGERGGYLPT